MSVLTNISLWGCSVFLLTDNGSQSMPRLAQAVYTLLRIPKIDTSSFHLCGKDGVERVNPTMTQMLVVVSNKVEDDWYVHYPHVVRAYNNGVRAAIGLAPEETRHGENSPPAPHGSYGISHHNLYRDQLCFLLFRPARLRACTGATRPCRYPPRPAKLPWYVTLQNLSFYTVDNLEWVYNTTATTW